MDAALQAYERFHEGTNPAGLNQAISYLERSLVLADQQDPEMLMRLNNLVIMLRERHQLTGNVADIVRAAEIAQLAIDILPTNDPEEISWRGELAVLHWRLYILQGESGLLDKAISSLTELTNDATSDDPKLSGRLTNLSLALTARYRAKTQPADMSLAIDYAKRAEDLAFEQDLESSIKSSNLAVAFMGRFEAYGDEQDMNEGIAAIKRAVQFSPEKDPNLVKYRVNMAGMLAQRYDRRGKNEDFEDAEAALRTVTGEGSIPPQSPAFVTLLGISATILGRKYEMTGEVGWLNEAITKHREIVELLPRQSPLRSKSKNNLAVGLSERHSSSGKNEDLNEAINLFKELESSEPSEGVEFPTILFNLSNCLNIEYEYSGKMQLLNGSIDYARRVAEIQANRNQHEPGRLSSLGEKLTTRFQRHKFKQDIVDARASLREELRLYPDNPKRASWLSSLAVAIEAYSQNIDDVGNDLYETIVSLEEEVERPTNQPLLLPQALNTIANRLALRFPTTKNRADIDKAIKLGERAAALLPNKSPDEATIKNNLGFALELRYNDSGEETDLSRAIACFTDAWKSEPSISFHRIKAAGRGIRLLGQSGDAGRGSELAKEVTDFLPILSTDVREFNDRMYAMSTYAGIAADTCALLLTLKREFEALQYAQKGRAVILRELMDLRAISQMQKYDMKLAERFQTLRSEATIPLQRIEDPVIRSQSTQRRRSAIDELQTMIKNQIREIPGLSQYQFDQSIEDMQKSAELGPLIMVNISDLRSDAIIVTTTAIQSLHLPHLKSQEVRSQLAGQWNGLMSKLLAGNEQYRKFLNWLWDNGVKQIMAELEKLTSVTNGSLLRVRWISSGLATSLPFHAAGDHSAGSTENVLSKAVSSYAPSTRFLSTERIKAKTGESAPRIQALIATMSRTPGYGDLSSAKTEGDLVRGILGHQVTPGGSKDRLTADEVKRHMQDCNIVHLACHGYVDPLDPSKSGLVFAKITADGTAEKDILTLREIAELNLQEAKVAFLSACSTARNSLLELTDESLTVVSGFQIAGFRHVIGALWPSFDPICKSVSETFYNAVLDQWDDDRVISDAVHKAVLKIRDQYPHQPLFWAQFVHFGT